MNNFNNRIDKMVSKILNEEIEKKVNKFTKEINEGEWKEIEVEEGLHGGQKKLDVAPPKGKLTAADFKKLRAKKETKEQTYFEDEFIDDEDFGEYNGDESEEQEAEELSQNEPTYVGRGLGDNKIKSNITNKIFGSFKDSDEWYDEKDSSYDAKFDFDFDEEEFDEFEPMYKKFGEKTRWFAPGEEGKKFFNMYKERFGPMVIRTPKSLGENDAETEEGNAFTDKLRKTKKGETFKLGNKTYKDTSNLDESVLTTLKDKLSAWAYDVDLDIVRKCKKETKGKGLKAFQDCMEENGAKLAVIGTRQGDAAMGGNWKEFGGSISRTDYKPKASKKETKESEDKWIQKTNMKKGGLHKKLGVPEGDKIPQSKLKSLKAELQKKAKGDKKLSTSDSKLLKQVNLALTLKNIKESKSRVTLTEDELIDMIERIVVEQKVKDKAEKNNISKKEPEGLKKTIKAQSASKKENEDYAKSVVKKMKDYVKAGSVGEFKEDSKGFPESNYSLAKMKAKTKKYHPSSAVDEYIENFAYPGLEDTKYDEIKPNEEWVTANIVGSSKTGNNPEWANAVKSDVGERVNNKRKKGAYQKEKMRSYNRVTQPVDETGENKSESSLDSVFRKLESVENKNSMKINEDMNKIKSLIQYDRKTQ